MKSIELFIADRTVREIISRILGCAEGAMTIRFGTTEVVARGGNSTQGKGVELFVTTPTRSWSFGTSGTGELRI